MIAGYFAQNDAMLKLERFTAIYNSYQGEDKHTRTVALDNLPDFLPRLDALKAKYPHPVQMQPKPATLPPSVPVTTGKFADGNVGEPW